LEQKPNYASKSVELATTANAFIQFLSNPSLDMLSVFPTQADDVRSQALWAKLPFTTPAEESVFGGGGTHSNIVRQWAELSQWYPSLTDSIGSNNFASAVGKAVNDDVRLDDFGNVLKSGHISYVPLRKKLCRYMAGVQYFSESTAMSGPSQTKLDTTFGRALTIVVILSCLPAALYAAFWYLAKLTSGSHDPAYPKLPALQDFLGICWFIVVLAGRPLFAVAAVVDVTLLFSRRSSVRQKLAGTALLLLALLGTLLVESQARAVRH
jgi:hypothetical protein